MTGPSGVSIRLANPLVLLSMVLQILWLKLEKVGRWLRMWLVLRMLKRMKCTLVSGVVHPSTGTFCVDGRGLVESVGVFGDGV